MLQLNTLVRFIHSHSPARLSKFKKILARRPKSVPTPGLERSECIYEDIPLDLVIYRYRSVYSAFHRNKPLTNSFRHELS